MANVHNRSAKRIAYILMCQLLLTIIWPQRNNSIFLQVHFFKLVSNWSYSVLWKIFYLNWNFSHYFFFKDCIHWILLILPFFIPEYTCAVFADAYTAVDDVSKGNHEVSIMSWLENMRTVDWVMWNANPNTKKYLWRLWTRGMYPAFVKCPL
jgi:hypothetical protein